MNEPQNIPPHIRLKELLAIPDRHRTEAQWDELIELEIVLAPGNREGAPEHKPGRTGPPPARRVRSGGGGGVSGGGGGGGGGGSPKKPFRKFHKKPPKPESA
jgi:hypothetical protein